MVLDVEAHQWIESYLAHERAGGAPATTLKTRRQHLRHAAAGVGSPVRTVTGDELLEWFGVQTWAVETRRGRRTTLRGFFAWAERTGRRDDNPALVLPRVKAVEGKARPAPDRIYLEALMRAAPRERLWLRLAAELGLRRAEIACIHADDLQEDLLGWSLLVHGKGRRERMVPLPRGLAEELRERGVGYAFPGDRDGHVSPEYLGKRLAAILEGHWTAHTLRHRFAARAYRVDRDLFVVQELLGHASPATTRRYVPAAEAEELRRTVNAAR